MMDIDDETLMALADGEITGDEAARLNDLISEDQDLAARYALFSQSAHWVKEASLANPDAAVSPDLEARIREMAASAPPQADNVVPLRPLKRQWGPMAIAASLALAVGLSAGLFLSSGAPTSQGPALTAEMRDRLDTLPSGAQAEFADGERLTIVASFTDGARAFCREYEIATPGSPDYVSVACRENDTWQLRFAVATSGDTGGYSPAASLETLDAFYAAAGASQPLAVEEEQQFLK